MTPLTVAVLIWLTVGTGVSGGGGRNVVVATNHADGRVSVHASLQVNRIPAERVEPVNLASASSSCTDCGTLAVALQLNLAPISARTLAPVNVANATNTACTRCVTVSRAIQVFLTVEDPREIPPGVLADLRALDLELARISSEPAISMSEAEARIDPIIARFIAAASIVSQERAAASGP